MLYNLLPARSTTTARLGTALLAGLVLAVGVFAIVEPVAADQRYRVDVTDVVDPNFRHDAFNVDKVKFLYEIVLEEDGTVYRHLRAELLIEAASALLERQEGALHMSLTDNRDDFLVGGSTMLDVRPDEVKWVEIDFGRQTEVTPSYFRITFPKLRPAADSVPMKQELDRLRQEVRDGR